MITEEVLQNNIGKYIRFQGNGIIDGLNCYKNKLSFYKIMFISEGGLELRRYCSKFNSVLPKHNWNQGFEIIDNTEYKSLPKY